MENSISVVIPTHNRPDGLAAAVKSVFNQTLLPKELIVVDDGSEPKVTKEIFNGCPDGLMAKLIRNEIPMGAPNARNRGIKEVSGEWVAFLDDDDEFFKEKIGVVNIMIIKNQHIDVFYHPSEINLIRENIKYISGAKDAQKYPNLVKQLLIKNIIGGTSMVIIRKSLLAMVKGFDETLPANEDKELFIRLAKQKARFFFINNPLTKYHHDTKTQSITHSHEKGQAAMELIKEKHATDFAQLNKKEQKYIQVQYFRNMAFKSLLNNDTRGALRNQFALCKQSVSPKDLVMLLIIPFGIKTVFWVRSLLN